MALPTPVLPPKTPSQVVRALAYLHATGTGTDKLHRLRDHLVEVGALGVGEGGDPLKSDLAVALQAKCESTNQKKYPNGTLVKLVNFLRAELEADKGDTTSLDGLREFHSKKQIARERGALKRNPVKDDGSPDVGKLKAREARERKKGGKDKPVVATSVPVVTGDVPGK